MIKIDIRRFDELTNSPGFFNLVTFVHIDAYRDCVCKYGHKWAGTLLVHGAKHRGVWYDFK